MESFGILGCSFLGSMKVVMAPAQTLFNSIFFRPFLVCFWAKCAFLRNLEWSP